MIARYGSLRQYDDLAHHAHRVVEDADVIPRSGRREFHLELRGRRIEPGREERRARAAGRAPPGVGGLPLWREPPRADSSRALLERAHHRAQPLELVQTRVL